LLSILPDILARTNPKEEIVVLQARTTQKRRKKKKKKKEEERTLELDVTLLKHSHTADHGKG